MLGRRYYWIITGVLLKYDMGSAVYPIVVTGFPGPKSSRMHTRVGAD
jgi:hypothetical protein